MMHTLTLFKLAGIYMPLLSQYSFTAPKNICRRLTNFSAFRTRSELIANSQMVTLFAQFLTREMNLFFISSIFLTYLGIFQHPQLMAHTSHS